MESTSPALSSESPSPIAGPAAPGAAGTARVWRPSRVPAAWASHALRYGLAAGAVALALLLKLALVPWVEQDTPFLLFFATVLAASLFGGLGPGLFATALSAAASAFFFMRPYQDIRVEDPVQRLRLAMFVAEGSLISVLSAVLLAARARAAAAAEKARRLEREILATSEGTRREVGHELHDGLGQHLAGAAFRARRLARQLVGRDAPEAADAQSLEALLARSVAWTRDLAAGLSPVGLRDDGLAAALQELAGSAERTFGVRCCVHTEAAGTCVGAGDALHLYHVAEQAVSDAATHASAKLIRLSLCAVPDAVVMTIEDDGTGAASRPAGRMNAMEHRARMIGARLDVTPLANRGTAVTCFYPRHAKSGCAP
jgi:signal transduction histidine kinase